MQIYKTIRELKQALPEVLARIQHCRLLADAELCIMESSIYMATEELTSDIDYGWESSHKAIQESCRNHMKYLTEAEYLQELVDKLKQYKI